MVTEKTEVDDGCSRWRRPLPPLGAGITGVVATGTPSTCTPSAVQAHDEGSVFNTCTNSGHHSSSTSLQQRSSAMGVAAKADDLLQCMQ